MGGYGSGRPRERTDTLDDFTKVRPGWIARQIVNDPDEAESSMLVYGYSVELDRTPANFGGWRAWFLCPQSRCGRRCAVLYLDDRGRLGCRLCLGALYRTQTKSRAGDRARLKAEKIRAKLGAHPSLLYPVVLVRRLHPQTRRRLMAELEAVEAVVWAAWDARFAASRKRLDRLLGEGRAARLEV